MRRAFIPISHRMRDIYYRIVQVVWSHDFLSVRIPFLFHLECCGKLLNSDVVCKELAKLEILNNYTKEE